MRVWDSIKGFDPIEKVVFGAFAALCLFGLAGICSLSLKNFALTISFVVAETICAMISVIAIFWDMYGYKIRRLFE